jgi:hypothetical protein
MAAVPSPVSFRDYLNYAMSCKGVPLQDMELLNEPDDLS